MTDIFDYLYWRGDLSTEQIPMNAVDGMVLARMSYLPFEYAAPLSAGKSVTVAEAAKDGKFLSKDDFRQRTKATKTVIDLMADLGLLGELPESNQLSLFDFA